MTVLSQGVARASGDDQLCEELWFRPEDIAAEADRASALFRTVENEIIPRLLLLHQKGADRGSLAPLVRRDNLVITADHVAAFTAKVLQSHEAAIAHLRDLVDHGAALDNLCLNLLAGTARHLGDLWVADSVSFTEVTIALGRLQGVLRALSSRMDLPANGPGAGRQALFASVPGEQHTFGLAMVCDFFRVSGWLVSSELPAHTMATDLLQLVAGQHIDVVGFAIGNDGSIALLAQLIREVRCKSLNPQVGVLVGGPLLVARPQIALLVGADATGADARQALLAAEKLLVAPRRGAL